MSLTSEVTRLLGSRWERFAEGPETFDCMGLCLYLCRVAGADVPRYPSRLDVRSFMALFEPVAHWRDLRPLDWIHEPRDHVYLHQHVAIVENKEYAVECLEGVGVRRRRLVAFDRSAARVYRLRVQE